MNRARLPTIRLSPLHRRTLYAIFTLLWASGALWLVFHYFLRLPSEFGDKAHPMEIWWLRLHGLIVFALLVGIGSVLPVHARLAWQLKRNRSSGLAMKITFLWLAATGYALYYFASDDNQDWLGLLHWAVGLSLPLMIALHVRRGHRSSRPRRLPTAAGREGSFHQDRTKAHSRTATRSSPETI